MIANTSYNDLIGTASADISDKLNKLSISGNNILNKIGENFKIDLTRFEIIGISISIDLDISLICKDQKQTIENNIVKIIFDHENDKRILNELFKSFEIILHDKNDKIFDSIDISQEINFEDLDN
jgi:hypothetical protein